MTEIQKQMIKDAYKSIIIYREALTNAFLQGYVSLEVKTKSDLFYTANVLERLLSGHEPTAEDTYYIDKECNTLDIMCEIYPSQFETVMSQLEAVGKAFEALQSLN